MKKGQRPTHAAAAVVKTPAARRKPSHKARLLRYGLYALLVVAAVGVRFWLKGPDIPTPPLEGLDRTLAEEIENARAAIWEAPRQPEKWGRLGMLLAAHSFPAEAAECFGRAENLDPENWKWPYLRSIAQEGSDPVAAREALHEAAVKADDEPLPRLLLVERLMELGELGEAGRHLQVALRLWPEDPRAQLAQARLLFHRDDAQAALAALKNKKAISDRHTRRVAHQLLVQIHRRIGDEAAASAALTRLQQLPPDEPWPDRWREQLDAFRTSKGAYIVRINELIERGDHDKLARTVAESIQRYPELAHLVTGRERLSRGDLAGAETALGEAVRLDPKSVDALLSLGEALLRQEKIAAAIETFGKATEVEPTHGEAHLRLGEALARHGRHDKALSSFRTAVQLMPTSHEAHRALAEALGTAGSAAEADEHRRHAERLASPKRKEQGQ